MKYLTIVEVILRTREQFFAEIANSFDLPYKITAMLVSSFLFMAIYGGVMGATHSIPQVISSFIKLPILFIVTLLICAPSLYFFSIFFGSHQTILQNIALVLTAMTTTAVFLVSFAPVTLFFLMTTSEYQFFKLLNVVVFAISGYMGVLFFRQGMRNSVDAQNKEGAGMRWLIFTLWIVLYGFVGTQMAWTLRPFIGTPNQEFALFRQVGGNFYENVVESFNDLVEGD